MSNPLLDFEKATNAYNHAVLNGDTDALVETAWRLYELHGCPLGDNGRAMMVWLKHETRCTQN